MNMFHFPLGSHPRGFIRPKVKRNSTQNPNENVPGKWSHSKEIDLNRCSGKYSYEDQLKLSFQEMIKGLPCRVMYSKDLLLADFRSAYSQIVGRDIPQYSSSLQRTLFKEIREYIIQEPTGSSIQPIRTRYYKVT